MRERGRALDELRAAPPVRVGPVTLLPIVRIVLRAGRGAGSVWASAAIEPYAIVVRDGADVRVLGVGGAAPTLDRLRGAIAGLDA